MKRMHLTRTRLGILLAVFAGVVLGAVFGQPGNSQASTSAVPTNKTLPTITGSPEAGQVLAGHRGTWNNAPKTFSYSWSRCDTSGNGCAAIGANARLYTVSATDVGHTLRVTVTARNASGAGHATSAPTAIVTPTGCPVGLRRDLHRRLGAAGTSRDRQQLDLAGRDALDTHDPHALRDHRVRRPPCPGRDRLRHPDPVQPVRGSVGDDGREWRGHDHGEPARRLPRQPEAAAAGGVRPRVRAGSAGDCGRLHEPLGLVPDQSLS